MIIKQWIMLGVGFCVVYGVIKVVTLIPVYRCRFRGQGGLCNIEPGECSEAHAGDHNIECDQNLEGEHSRFYFVLRNIFSKMLREKGRSRMVPFWEA